MWNFVWCRWITSSGWHWPSCGWCGGGGGRRSGVGADELHLQGACTPLHADTWWLALPSHAAVESFRRTLLYFTDGSRFSHQKYNSAPLKSLNDSTADWLALPEKPAQAAAVSRTHTVAQALACASCHVTPAQLPLGSAASQAAWHAARVGFLSALVYPVPALQACLGELQSPLAMCVSP